MSERCIHGTTPVEACGLPGCMSILISELKRQAAENEAAIRAAVRILRESGPNTFAGAWLPDYEKAHAPAIQRATARADQAAHKADCALALNARHGCTCEADQATGGA